MNFRNFNQRDFTNNNNNNNNSLSGSEPDDNSNNETHTIDNDLHLGKNASIPEVQQPKFRRPLATSSTQRKKSILKPSRTFDRSSSDEQIVKNNYFLEKGNAHHNHEPPSEISEIEKAASFINNKTAEEYIVKEENSQAENTPQNNRPPTKIPNFGVLSKFSPNRDPNNNPLLDISSPISQNFDEQDRNATEESQKEHIVGKIQKIEGKLLPPSLPLEAHQPTEITKDRSNSNRLFTETPLFKTEKAKKLTTESNSQNPGSGSITIIQNEEQANPPSIKEDGRSKMLNNSEAMDSYQRRLNDSTVSKRKKATFFANEAKNGNIIPGYTRYVLDENINQQQVYMPHFSDREIFESFKTLDINKAGYITGIEIKHFLEVLEEEVNEAEIEEMVRMLDYEGTQRVRYEEFYKMATGKNLNPIGQAYPPTLDLFEKKKNAEIIYDSKKRAEQTTMAYEHSGRNQSSRTPQAMALNKESARYSGMGPASRAELDSIYPKHTAKIDNKLSKLPRLGDLGDEGVKPIKTDKDETDTYFKGFIRQAGLSVKTYMEKYDIVQFSNHHKVAKATYKDFLGFFVIDDQDVTKKIFSLVGRDRNYIDLRQMMIAISMYLEFNADEKISLAYDLYDPENHGYILYMELMKVFNMFQIGEENKKLERKIKTILNRRSVMPEDSISKEEFVIICKNFPDLFN